MTAYQYRGRRLKTPDDGSYTVLLFWDHDGELIYVATSMDTTRRIREIAREAAYQGWWMDVSNIELSHRFGSQAEASHFAERAKRTSQRNDKRRRPGDVL